MALVAGGLVQVVALDDRFTHLALADQDDPSVVYGVLQWWE